MPHGERGGAVAQLHNRRNTQPACHNGGMADGAVLIAGKPQHHAAVNAEQIAGEKPIRHQNARAGQVQAAARASVQNIHHALADIADIHAALPDVFIVHIAQALGKNLLGALHGGGAARPGGNVIADLIGEGVILQQGDLKQQDIGVGTLGALAQAAQFVLGKHHGHVVQGALPKRVAHNAVQPGGAVVDPLHRTQNQPGGCRYTGKRIHKMTSLRRLQQA